ncbi:DUF1801 domain-containing protein [bacterium]|jgi:hypothetical protein|nr:DUF1801 domain-containing protein [bacterium]
MTPEEYYKSMSEKRAVDALIIHQLILKLFPTCTVSMLYKMPTYQTELGFVAIGNKKHHWALYTCSAEKIKPYIEKHPDIKHGVGCLNFRAKDILDIDTIAIVLNNALNISK